MIGDYFRAAAGLVPAAAVLATLPLASITTVVLGGFAALFAGFGIRTIIRHQTRLEVTGSALRATGLRRASIIWEELDRMNLATIPRAETAGGLDAIDSSLWALAHSARQPHHRICRAGRDFGPRCRGTRLELERGHRGEFGCSRSKVGR